MLLSSPIVITPRLLPGVRIGDAWVSIARNGITRDNRDRFDYWIDFDGQEVFGSDLCSGVGGCSLQSALASLLSFLGAFAESIGYETRTGRDSENSDMFPAILRDWAYLHAEEFSILEDEIENTPDLINE